MSAIDERRFGDLRDRYQHCFGCGTANPMGLRLSGFESIDGGIRASFVPRPEYSGFADTLHGGILAAVLDEASAWAALSADGVLVFTAKLEIRYRRAARIGGSYEVTARIVQRRGRRIVIDAAIADADGVIAGSEGLFVVAEDHTAEFDDQENTMTTPRPSTT